MVAGEAEGIDLWKISSIQDEHPKQLFVPQIAEEGLKILEYKSKVLRIVFV